MSAANLALQASLVILVVALPLTVGRLFRGPSLPDRVIAFDLLTMQSLGILVTLAILTEQALLLDAAIVLALMTFLATLALARHIERTAHRGPEGPT